MGNQEKNYLGSNLKLLSAAYDISQGELGKRAGMDASYVSRILNSKPEDGSRRPSIDTLFSLADVFEIDLETLVRVDLVGELKARIKKK